MILDSSHPSFVTTTFSHREKMGQMAPMTTTPTNSVPPLPISKTCIYKVVGKISIPIDIYLPASKKDGEELDLHPVVLFIHGGGWLGSNRSDYCRPLFHEFLKLGFVVTSMDYRLRPETSLDGQLSDIRDVEYWLRNTLAAETRYCRIEVDASEIVVVGASAGAHLALMTVSIPLQPFSSLRFLSSVIYCTVRTSNQNKSSNTNPHSRNSGSRNPTPSCQCTDPPLSTPCTTSNEVVSPNDAVCLAHPRRWLRLPTTHNRLRRQRSVSLARTTTGLEVSWLDISSNVGS